MSDEPEITNSEPLEDMVEVLTCAGPFAYGSDQKLCDCAREWLDAGFAPEMADQWLAVRCFEPTVARQFEDEGLEPEDVDFTTPKPYVDTIAYKACDGVMSVDAAVRVARSRRG
jgi:hypothetical protein